MTERLDTEEMETPRGHGVEFGGAKKRMGWRDPGEPEHPRSRAEVDAVCARLVTALQTHLGERLVCVLLCGSWARNEARPPESDLDLTVVVDTVDPSALE